MVLQIFVKFSLNSLKSKQIPNQVFKHQIKTYTTIPIHAFMLFFASVEPRITYVLCNILNSMSDVTFCIFFIGLSVHHWESFVLVLNLIFTFSVFFVHNSFSYNLIKFFAVTHSNVDEICFGMRFEKLSATAAQSGPFLSF